MDGTHFFCYHLKLIFQLCMIEQNKKQSKPIQINIYLEKFTGRKNVRVYYSGALSRPKQGRLQIWMELIFFVTT